MELKKPMLINLIALLISWSQVYSHDYLTKNDVRELYERHVKIHDNDEYTNRYVPLPLHKNRGPWRWEGKDFPRVISLLEFEKFIKEHDIRPKKVLAIEGYYPSIGKDPECYCLLHEKMVFTTYQTQPERHDLHDLQLQEGDFDFVMMNQVLEHVVDPIRALRNVFRYMKDGGLIYISVPVTNLPHDTPYHYYTGYTPVGLGALAKTAGFEILEIGQWGNYEYIERLFRTYEWPDYRALNNPGLNEIKFPVITWVFAKKSSS
jgi:SAM-dependent methyltransferase